MEEEIRINNTSTRKHIFSTFNQIICDSINEEQIQDYISDTIRHNGKLVKNIELLVITIYNDRYNDRFGVSPLNPLKYTYTNYSEYTIRVNFNQGYSFIRENVQLHELVEYIQLTIKNKEMDLGKYKIKVIGELNLSNNNIVIYVDLEKVLI